MTKTELLQQLETASGSFDRWQFDITRQRYTLVVGEADTDYTVHVDKRRGQAEWQVEHARYGVLVPWTPALVISYARLEAMDFVRAHILSIREPQHAD